MKTLIFTFAMAFIAFGTLAATSAYAHCGVCEASVNKAGKIKPCTKCMEAGKPCKCAKKKAMSHDDGNKPCKMCDKSDKRMEMNKDMQKGSYTKTEKGDYQVQSRGPRQSNYND